jgi:hypothetical protein
VKAVTTMITSHSLVLKCRRFGEKEEIAVASSIMSVPLTAALQGVGTTYRYTTRRWYHLPLHNKALVPLTTALQGVGTTYRYTTRYITYNIVLNAKESVLRPKHSSNN